MSKMDLPEGFLKQIHESRIKQGFVSSDIEPLPQYNCFLYVYNINQITTTCISEAYLVAYNCDKKSFLVLINNLIRVSEVKYYKIIFEKDIVDLSLEEFKLVCDYKLKIRLP